ncbi:MAG: alpha-L-rhamnosidase [Phycisphaerae bacterium]|nr:alpha-L-rhamnosidase [Phycisphaerae bacterium]
MPLSSEIKRTFLSPVRVMWHTPNVRDAELLLRPGLGQALHLASPPPSCCMDSREGVASLLVDFGQELFGGLQFVTNRTRPDKAPVKVRVRLGESVSEAMGQPNNDHGVNDEVISLPWLGVTEFGKTGFRFARLDVEDPRACLDLCELRAYTYGRDLAFRGTFECSDEKINRIWAAATRSVYLNMQEYLWDGIKRDRLVWMGDMHPEIRVISAVFGEADIVPNSLDLLRDLTPLPEFFNRIPSYSMWWVLAQHHWYLWHGNMDYLRQQESYLRDLLKVFEGYIDETGGETLPEQRFIDWLSVGDDAAVHVGLQSLLVMTLSAGADLLRTLGDAQAAEHYASLCRPIQAYVPPATMNKPVNALRVLAGCGDAVEVNRDVLSHSPLEGLSTFYGYYVLLARAAAGDYAGCFELLRKYWGGMLDLGATTFWEHFDVGWLNNAGRIDELRDEKSVDVHDAYGKQGNGRQRNSFCHGWAGGPTAWLSEYVLGVSPASPGCRTVHIRPNLVDLKWAKGTIPAPVGEIEVSLSRNADGTTAVKTVLPDGVRQADD